jgi:hypothetical protein
MFLSIQSGLHFCVFSSFQFSSGISLGILYNDESVCDNQQSLVLFQHLHGVTDENHEKSSQNTKFPKLKFGSGAYQI